MSHPGQGPRTEDDGADLVEGGAAFVQDDAQEPDGRASWRVQPREVIDRAVGRAADWRTPDWLAVPDVTGVAGAVRNIADWVRPSGPYRIDGYRSYGDTASARLTGRVLASPPPGEAQPGEHQLRSAGRMATRFMTAEVAQVEVELHWEGASVRTETNDEGYFSVDMSAAALPATEQSVGGVSWSRALSRVLDDETGASRWWPIEVVTIGPAVDRIVISDIDDTVLLNGTGDAARTVLATVSGSELTREAVSGAAELYRQLGPPIFYVSSSPWNLYDFLVAFFSVQGFPDGPLLLREIGLNRRSFSDSSHRRHKLDTITDILMRLEHVSAVLIGDSSLQDAHAFAELIESHPGRIEAAFLRDVGDEERTSRARDVIDQRPADAVPMRLVGEMREIADYLASVDPTS